MSLQDLMFEESKDAFRKGLRIGMALGAAYTFAIIVVLLLVLP